MNPKYAPKRSSKTASQMVYGMQPILEAFHAGKSIDKIFILRTLKTEDSEEVLNFSKGRNVPVSRVPEEKLNRLCSKNHQGVIAFMSAIDYQPLNHIVDRVYEEAKMPLILILDRITDVRNLGAIARTAACVGVHAIVIPVKGSATVGADAIKTSAGALNRIPVCREESLKKVVKYLQDYGIQVVACTEKASHKIYDLDLQQPTAMIMGSEEDGISDDLIKMADHLGKLPMDEGGVSSLNVSVAAGAILFEAVRQRLG